MNFTINEVASKFGLSAHTLRYYDKEGLLPFVSRNKSGIRIFTEMDLEWVSLICCLKDTGMPIKEIKQYSDWCKQGSATIEVRKKMLADHKLKVLEQIQELNNNLKQIDKKLDWYEDPELMRKIDEQLEHAVPEK
ncbi:DNA-binding transcriptional regulator, MerR family [Paenibacillus catalpae]|uniref:DNA-binding transcriptional regulator, MerR family n=1 Tax=Paenibacillus catalpae TaxID=1045775 RepID=A0A1I2BLB9_9BACL|nr:MerR family transcriptional regulator [Paenibacillus catalpae]SFE56598.1 DNA-binding transcriptional regulator, MerR family [Paenibacillus catalpae]